MIILICFSRVQQGTTQLLRTVLLGGIRRLAVNRRRFFRSRANAAQPGDLSKVSLGYKRFLRVRRPTASDALLPLGLVRTALRHLQLSESIIRTVIASKMDRFHLSLYLYANTSTTKLSTSNREVHCRRGGSSAINSLLRAGCALIHMLKVYVAAF